MLALLVVLAAAPGEWTPLAPGVEYRTFVLAERPAEGDGLAHVVRVDASVAALDFGLASERGGALRTAREWCEGEGFLVVINAGMYGTDYLTNVGHLRRGKHFNNRAWNAKYLSVLAFQPRGAGAPAVMVDVDDPAVDAKALPYESAVQNLRLIKAPGVSVWKPNGQPWNEALVAQDAEGRLLFVFVRTPFEMAELNEKLLALPLGIVRAMHMDGGPPASLSICAPSLSLHLGGGRRRMRFFGADTGRQERIPNVLGVRRP
jgi:hypothetical protein